MTTQLSLDPSRTAVLSMDLQAGIVSTYATGDPGLVRRAAGLLAQARILGMRVIHVKVGFRPGFPEIGSRNPLFGALKSSPTHQKLFEGAAGEVDPGVAPEPGDIVVTKHRVSAFLGTDLEMILRANEIETLILWGISTSGVLLSTALYASDADFRLLVVKDCCLDREAETHEFILGKILAGRSTIVSASELLEVLKNTPPRGQ